MNRSGPFFNPIQAREQRRKFHEKRMMASVRTLKWTWRCSMMELDLALAAARSSDWEGAKSHMRRANGFVDKLLDGGAKA